MKTVRISLAVLAVWTVLAGLIYPALITLIAQTAFPGKSNGSPVTFRGRVVGSELIGQEFTGSRYFSGRPSAGHYQGRPSGGFNFGPGSAALAKAVLRNVADVRKKNGLEPDRIIPADLVLASASGLDPDISVESARIQADRVARARSMPVRTIMRMIDQETRRPVLGFWGMKRVNVLRLNIRLDTEEEKIP